MKQTAVEFLEEKFNNNNANFINWSEDYFNEAKEMEKEQQGYSEEEVKPLLDAIEYFINRVENGTIRSKTTYNMYKEILLQFKNK
jgi:hypothetical protein